MVFLVDFQNLDFRNKLRFTQAWEDLIAQTDGLQIPRAVYLINQVGRLEELAALTQDPELLLDAAREVSERSNVRKSVRDERIEDTDPGDEMLRRYRDRDRALYTYELLTQFAEGLSARSGRTALVWVSTGVSLMYEAAYSTAGTTGRPTFGGSPNPMILARQRAFHRAANSANVSVYTIDPTPKIEQVLGMADARYGTIGADGQTPLAANMQMGFELDAIRNSLRLASRDTGGKSFIGWADLTEVLRDIEADTGRYYLLTYAAPEPEGDGDYHDIRVEVLREDVDVRARDGYYDYDAEDRRSRFVSAALSLPGTVADLPVYAQATRSWSADGTATVMLSVAVNAEDLGIGVDDDGIFAGFEIHAAALDERLDLKEEHHSIRRRRLRPLAPDGSPVEGLAPISNLPAGDLLVHRAEWTLPPNDYDVRVMVLDENTGRVGSARMQVEIPANAADVWGTSDLLLIETDGAGNARPVVDGRVPAERVVSAFLEVYNGISPAVRGFIQAIDSPASALTEGAEIFFTPLYPDADGIHRGAVVLPPLATGTYSLRLEFSDAGVGAEKSFDTHLEVLARPRR
jgi:VWFA-related protein